MSAVEGIPEGTFGSAFAPFMRELGELVAPGGPVLDAHTHLGADEDGQSQTPEALIEHLDMIGPHARACVFPFHDPERSPAYRVPNDRVLEWAAGSGGRLTPFCRLDPTEDPLPEAERCLAAGARGIKLHPRAQLFGFAGGELAGIFALAAEAGVPILVHAGRGMPPMDDLAELALGHPEVTLILAHGAIAGQGMFASRLAEHPAVLYDTSCFSSFDVVELFARVPAERVVFASDAPYGRPVLGLYLAMRAAARAGVDDAGRSLIAGGTLEAALAGESLAPARAPRLDSVRPVNGRLQRVSGYLLIAFGAMMGDGHVDFTRIAGGLALARDACRDPEPGAAGPALARIDSALAAAQTLLASGGENAFMAMGLMMASAALAGTEPIV